MLRNLFTPPWKIVSEILQKIGCWHTNSKFMTSYKELAVLVVSDIIKKNKINAYITAMNNAIITPELLIKYSTLIHIYLQQSNNCLPEQNVTDFLGHLLQISELKIQQYTKMEEEQGSFSSNLKSFCSRSASTRSQEIVICKEVFLISTVVRPYIAFLLKYSYTLEPIKVLKLKQNIQTHQAWTVINLLKMIVSVTGNFTMIGRYYIKSYGFLIILLTKTFSNCIRVFMEILSKYVNIEKTNYNELIDIQGYEFGEFVNMLQQIGKINDKLLPLYLSKYFFDHIQDIPEPKWINTSCPDFDKIFQLNKTSRHNKDLSVQRERRNLKQRNLCEITQNI